MGYSTEDAMDAIGMGRAQILVFLVAGLMIMSDAFEMTLMSFVGPTVRCEWNLEDGDDAWITTSVFIGFFVGSPCWGYLSDRFSRKTTMQLACAFTSTTGVLSALAPDIYWLCLLRGICGVGLSAIAVAADYMIEFCPSKNRGRAFMILMASWGTGAVVLALFAWAILPLLGWRWLTSLSSLPLFVCGMVLFLVPETPRALAAQGHHQQALQVLQDLASANGATLPEGELAVIAVEEGEPMPLLTGYAELVAPSRRAMTVMLALLHFCGAYIYYGAVILATESATSSHKGHGCAAMDDGALSPLTEDDFLTVILTASGEVPGILLAALVVEWIGRKNLMVSLLTIAAISFGLVALESSLMAKSIFLMFSRPGGQSTLSACFLYCREAYPTKIRSTASTTLNSCARIGGILVPQLVQATYQAGYKNVAYGSIIGVSVVGMLCAMSLPPDKTNQQMAEDVAGSGTLKASLGETRGLIAGLDSKAS